MTAVDDQVFEALAVNLMEAGVAAESIYLGQEDTAPWKYIVGILEERDGGPWLFTCPVDSEFLTGWCAAEDVAGLVVRELQKTRRGA